MTAQMRTGPAARNADFRGIDPPALNQLLKQMQEAATAIRGWLNGHRPPPGVSAAGYRQADQVAQWTADQLGMLTRRYNYAVTHPDRGGGVQTPPAPSPAPGPSGGPGTGATRGVPTPRGGAGKGGQPSKGGGAPSRPFKPAPAKPPRNTTPNGAGDIGNFPTREAAAKAARADALAVSAALKDHKPVPDQVWKHLKANADDPDYTEKLYERLGPAGVAALLQAADGNKTRLGFVQESLGTASHHLTMDVTWLRTLLEEAESREVRSVAVQVLTGADMSQKARDALAKLGLHGPTAASPQSDQRQPALET
ncbi:hypothetical protein [Actinomadura miaoliensis]|uniref:HEAT repeat domain-containing protein n=1 Tax=Actinomadura miaoliensis TaxID=430685 RepID=A0ABP7WQ91_9ACTN